MSLRGSRVQTRRRLMISSPYTNSNLDLTDDDLVLLRDRDDTILEELTIEEMIERFGNMPSVQAFGISRVEIFIRETNLIERIVRTRWDDLRERQNELRRLEIKRQIERLQNESSLT